MKFEESYAHPNWIYHGLTWGGFMFLVMEILIPFADSEPITLKSFLVGTIVWALAGLAWGFVMHLGFGRRGNKVD
jgi:hypothetical protein